jgi:hypothetical protein
MSSLPHTSETHYITGKAALNVPNDDGTFADWHFDEVFLSGRGKIRVAGADAPETSDLLGNYGIRECSGVLRRFGVPVQPGEKVYAANHIRAILDMALSSIAKRRLPEHVNVQDMLDSPQEIGELRAQVQRLKVKITDQLALSLLSKWEQQQI